MKTYKTDSPQFSETLNIVETTDPVHADVVNGINKELFENTLVLKKALEEPSGVTAGTYRSVTVDKKGRVVAGSNPATYTHPDSGVTAGTYDSVTVNTQGHVISGSNPTRVTAGTYKSVTVNAQGYVTSGSNPNTLAGFGITNTRPVVISSSAPGDTTALWIS